MRPTFAAQFKFPCMFRIEKDNALDPHQSVFRSPKTEGINTRTPCHFSRRRILRHNCVRKSRTVHMQGKTIGFGHI